ncbi:hypothetical protein Poli38472_000512 [Pythium oligandrum]|uniref:Uncharacterized protein n=1 Tax=Pythium oligandrum TaxID=41045 RepID=A0A8K1CCV1_PYTOL|nr:hypothetical protein Poli38472_000512 [Pythium oligandrum]|eukprot:TMW60470.1 hypothetical protein Poli38472_000512 [Pythium oligandrum]
MESSLLLETLDASGLEVDMRFLDDDAAVEDVDMLASALPLSSSSDNVDDLLQFPLLPLSPLSTPVSPAPLSPMGFDSLGLDQADSMLCSALSPAEPSNPIQWVEAASSSSSSTESSVRPKHKAKRPANYNSNKAREERRQELLTLRKKAEEYEEKLQQLKHKQRRIGGSSSFSSSLLVRSSLPSPNLWRGVAAQQLEARRRAEQENIQIKLMLEHQINVAMSLGQLFNAYTSLAAGDMANISGGGRVTRVFPTTASSDLPRVYATLLHTVDRSYVEIDNLFARMGISQLERSYRNAQMHNGVQGLSLEFNQCKILPVNFLKGSAALWQHIVYKTEHAPFRHHYKSPHGDIVEDIIIENIGMEYQANGGKADLSVQQVFRRYVTKDRVVILWNALITPVVFSDKQLSGVVFQEQGYVMFKSPKTPGTDEFCILNTAHIITPEFTNGSLQKNDVIAGMLTDLVLQLVLLCAANIPFKSSTSASGESKPFRSDQHLNGNAVYT